ncbi:unnamed protein product [Symbiodinium sp. CCMP2456]|nr:unnamed protein product [Symbiodinium sp. CCMP2456]
MDAEQEEMTFFTKYWPIATGAQTDARKPDDPDAGPAHKLAKTAGQKGEGRAKDHKGKGRNPPGNKRQYDNRGYNSSGWGSGTPLINIDPMQHKSSDPVPDPPASKPAADARETALPADDENLRTACQLFPQGARAVAEQELMSAEAQASLLSSMMNKGPVPGEAVEAPEPMDAAHRETKRQAEMPEEDGAGITSQQLRDWDQDDREERPLDRATEKKLFSLCLSMSRLMMRHEDQLSINRAQDNYVMFAQTQGVLSAVPELFKATEAWRQMKKEQPELLLRTWMLGGFADGSCDAVRALHPAGEGHARP